MQPGYPGSGQDPYGQQPPYSDPYAQPQYPPQQQPQPPQSDPYGPPQPPQPPQPPLDPYGQPQPPYQDPSAQPTSGPGYPGAPQYPATGYDAPAQQNNTLGLLGMILGFVAIPGACCSFFGLLPSAAAIVLSILGMKKVKEGQADNRGQALAGLICGSIGLVLSIAFGALFNLSKFTLSP